MEIDAGKAQEPPESEPGSVEFKPVSDDVETKQVVPPESDEEFPMIEIVKPTTTPKKPVEMEDLVGALQKKQLKVLLVDDEKEFVESLSERLELRNLKPGIAYDGEQAIETVKKEKPDVMVLDLRMPGIDGLEVLRKVKKKNPDLWIRFLKVYRKHKVKFNWVKGHANIPENERCDQLAVEASKKANLKIDHEYENSIKHLFQ